MITYVIGIETKEVLSSDRKLIHQLNVVNLDFLANLPFAMGKKKGRDRSSKEENIIDLTGK